MKPSHMVYLLTEAVKANYPVLMVGEPGCGKTAMANQVAVATDHALITLFLSQSDPTDAKGMPAIINGEAQIIPFNDLKEIVNAKKPTIVFLDDLCQSMPATQAAFMNLLSLRKVGNANLPTHVKFIGATNDNSHMAATNGAIEPLKGRFYSIVNVDNDLNDLIAWGHRNQMHPMLLAWCRYAGPDKVFSFKPTPDLTNSCTARNLEHLSCWMKLNLIPDVQYDVYKGAVGEQVAKDVMSFIEIANNLPDYRQVFNDPHHAEIPDHTGALYAMIAQITSHASAENLDQIMVYGNRLEHTTPSRKEFAIFMVLDIYNRYQPLRETEAITLWAVDHQDVIFG